MKKRYLLFFFIFLNAVAQTETIEKADGTIISTSKIEYSHDKHLLTYREGKQKRRIDFSDLKSVTGNNYKFRYFSQARNFNGMFIKAETEDKILAFVHYDGLNQMYTTTASDGTGVPSIFSVKDWDIVYWHVRLTVFDKQGNVIEDMDIRTGRIKRNIEERVAAIDMIRRHFSDCPVLINEIDSCLASQDDPRKLLIAFYFMQRESKDDQYKYLECK